MLIYLIEVEREQAVFVTDYLYSKKGLLVENLNISVSYTEFFYPNASDVCDFEVTLGELVSGDVDALDERGEGELIVVESEETFDVSGLVSKEVDVIEDSDFNIAYAQGWQASPWTPINGTAEWEVEDYEVLGVDVGAKYGLWTKKSDSASLEQEFEISQDFQRATLNYSYYLFVIRPGHVKKFELLVYIDDVLISNHTDYSTVSLILSEMKTNYVDVTDYVSVGSHTLKFIVNMEATGKKAYFEVWIDKVTLKTTHTLGGGLGLLSNEAEFEITLDEDAMGNPISFDAYLLSRVNTSALVYVFEYDEGSNVWLMDYQFYATADEWFNITFDSSRVKVHLLSQSNLRVELDYLYINASVIDDDGIVVKVENSGLSDVKVVAVWLINSTIAERKAVDQYVLKNEELEIDIPIAVKRGVEYEVRVVTSYDVYVKKFAP